MTELQKRPKYQGSNAVPGDLHDELDYYKARCALAEEALKFYAEQDPSRRCVGELVTGGDDSLVAKTALEIIAASETP